MDSGPLRFPPHLWLLALSTAILFLLGWRERQAAQVVAAPRLRQAPCADPVDWVGRGLLCQPLGDAAGQKSSASQAVPQARRLKPQTAAVTAPGPLRPLSPLRQLLAGGQVDLAQADEVALQALPEVGESLARSLVTARRAGRLRCISDLAAIPGLGRLRMLRLLRYVAPLPQDCPQSHPSK